MIEGRHPISFFEAEFRVVMDIVNSVAQQALHLLSCCMLVRTSNRPVIHTSGTPYPPTSWDMPSTRPCAR